MMFVKLILHEWSPVFVSFSTGAFPAPVFRRELSFDAGGVVSFLVFDVGIFLFVSPGDECLRGGDFLLCLEFWSFCGESCSAVSSDSTKSPSLESLLVALAWC